jgi:hypothetical protein
MHRNYEEHVYLQKSSLFFSSEVILYNIPQPGDNFVVVMVTTKVLGVLSVKIKSKINSQSGPHPQHVTTQSPTPSMSQLNPHPQHVLNPHPQHVTTQSPTPSMSQLNPHPSTLPPSLRSPQIIHI